MCSALPDRPWLPFNAAHHLELFQVPEADCPAKMATGSQSLMLSRALPALYPLEGVDPNSSGKYQRTLAKGRMRPGTNPDLNLV